MKVFLKNEDLKKLLARFVQEGRLFAPVRRGGYSGWDRVSSVDEVVLSREQAILQGEEVNTREPAKVFVFPRSETLFEFEGEEAVETGEIPELVVFGLRPCDGRAMAFLERFFVGNGPEDPRVRQRREKVTLIGVACNSPADSCFCTAVGGGPHENQGLDVLLREVVGGFLGEAVTSKGEELLTGFPEATAQQDAEAEKLKANAEATLALKIDLNRLKAALDNGFASPIWERLTLECVNCGACTFLCPTCHCFDVFDETVRGRKRRSRIWDSCQFTLYSQHASGHNPRLNPAARYRNRVMDKFKYTVDMLGEVSCVGCGRCVRVCPAGIDIRVAVAEILKEAAQDGR
ncbi:MAG: 4Fe-4S dicluster domain-containing protein [candidate division WOR-3 bacterium]|nr:4Fe-4S dicluster domain-containing protein [candidate division WOR-3 bacterium]